MLSVGLCGVTAEISDSGLSLKDIMLSGRQEILKIISEVMLRQKQCDDSNKYSFFTNLVLLL